MQTSSSMTCLVEPVEGVFDLHIVRRPQGLGGPGITSGVGLMAKAFSASSQDDCDLVHGNDGCAG
jgi:hypothetical protein